MSQKGMKRKGSGKASPRGKISRIGEDKNSGVAFGKSRVEDTIS
jgi:hypothetical protein